MPDKVRLPRLHCLRCGHDWIPRTERPETCPKCHSAYWHRPRKEDK